MAWLVLVVSGVLEAVWAVALGKSEGFSRLHRPWSSLSDWRSAWAAWHMRCEASRLGPRMPSGSGSVRL